MAKENQVQDVPSNQEVEEMRSLRSTRPSTESNVFIEILVGIVGTIIVAFGVMPLKGTKFDYFYGLINQRGPVQYLELLMAFMVATMIFLKSRIVRKQLSVIASNPLPHDLDLNDDRQLQNFRDELAKRDEFSWSILLNRLDRAIALWLGSKDIGRVSSWAQTESGRDTSTSDSSYSLSRVLMWAIPILGFIGTVQGLGVAVAGFGVLGGAAEVSAIKQAIGQVTVGLGVAFDTTLLALILTTFLMFPLTSFQSREENLFGELDNYLDDVLLARLPSPEHQPIVIENLEDSIEAAFRRYIPDPDRYDEVFTRSIEKAATAVEERFNNLSKSYETTVRDLTDRLSSNLTQVGSSLEQTLRNVVGDVHKQDEAMIKARKQIGEEEVQHLRSVFTDIHVTAERVAEEYRKNADSLRQVTQESTQQAAQAAKELTQRMEGVARLATGIQDLLKIDQAVEKALTNIAASDDFRKTLEDLRKHLDVTNAFCSRLSKPRVITLREELK